MKHLTCNQLDPSKCYELHIVHKKCNKENLKNFYKSIHTNNYFELKCPYCNVITKIFLSGGKIRESQPYVNVYYTEIIL